MCTPGDGRTGKAQVCNKVTCTDTETMTGGMRNGVPNPARREFSASAAVGASLPGGPPVVASILHLPFALLACCCSCMSAIQYSGGSLPNTAASGCRRAPRSGLCSCPSLPSALQWCLLQHCWVNGGEWPRPFLPLHPLHTVCLQMPSQFQRAAVDYWMLPCIVILQTLFISLFG